MNKGGAEKIFSVYWFAILFIVAAAIVYMVSSFYGKPYDVRDVETGLLTDKAATCLSLGGYITGNWQALNNNTFLAECGLNFNVEDAYGWNDNQYLIEIEFLDFNSGLVLKEISVGNPNLKFDCAVEDRNFPVCLEREMYTIDKADRQYKIKIFSAVRKTEKNAQ